MHKRFIISSWLTRLWGLVVPKTDGVSQQTGDPGEPMIQFQSESEVLRTSRADGVVLLQSSIASRPRKSQCPSSRTVRQEKFSPSSKVSLFVLLRPSTDSMKRAICLTQSTNSNVNLIQKHPHGHIQNNVWGNVWTLHGPVKLTHKINYCRK